jgi:hypothetical protein
MYGKNEKRTGGYTYQKIADKLNLDNVGTKTRKGIWYSKVVRGVFLSKN